MKLLASELSISIPNKPMELLEPKWLSDLLNTGLNFDVFDRVPSFFFCCFECILKYDRQYLN